MEQATLNATLASLMKNYANYNLWANKQLIEWLRTKPSEKMEQEIPSSFSSIRKTFLHIWQTEAYWYSILTQTPPPSFTADTFEGSTEDAFDGLLAQSNAIAVYIDKLDESAILENCHLDSPWVKGSLPKFEFIQHLISHSTYHRGQVVTIGRNLGFTDAPMTDYNFYNFYGK